MLREFEENLRHRVKGEYFNSNKDIAIASLESDHNEYIILLIMVILTASLITFNYL